MSTRIPGGYILLSRKLIESEIWDKPPLYAKVWLYLLSRAQHKSYKNMERGQLRTSIPEIIEACSWKVGYRTEKPTRDQVFNILEWLRRSDEGGNDSNEDTTMITTTRVTHGLLVNISNYSFYQDPKNYEGNTGDDDEIATKRLREQRHPDNINKNVKNDKNEQEVIKDNVADAPSIDSVDHENQFEEWWNLYGNKKGRKKCIAKYKLLLKEYSHEQMMTGTNKYLDYRKELVTRGDFLPQQKNPLTFLNGENFNDEYEMLKEDRSEAPKTNLPPGLEW